MARAQRSALILITSMKKHKNIFVSKSILISDKEYIVPSYGLERLPRGSLWDNITLSYHYLPLIFISMLIRKKVTTSQDPLSNSKAMASFPLIGAFK